MVHVQPPRELYVDWDGETVSYTEVVDVPGGWEAEAFAELVAEQVGAFGIPEESVDVTVTEGGEQVRAGWSASVDDYGDGATAARGALYVLSAEALLALDSVGGDVDDVWHAVKAFGGGSIGLDTGGDPE